MYRFVAQKEVSLLSRVLHVHVLNNYKRYGFWFLFLGGGLFVCTKLCENMSAEN